jgi:hypothetical protein
LGQDETEIFLQMGLDRNLVICPSGSQIEAVQQFTPAESGKPRIKIAANGRLRSADFPFQFWLFALAVLSSAAHNPGQVSMHATGTIEG